MEGPKLGLVKSHGTYGGGGGAQLEKTGGFWSWKAVTLDEREKLGKKGRLGPRGGGKQRTQPKKNRGLSKVRIMNNEITFPREIRGWMMNN